jgi:transposase
MRKPKSPSQLGFNRFDKVRLQNGLNEVSEGRITLRITAVLLCAEGRSIPSVARLLKRSFQIVYHWVELYLQTHRVEALLDAPKSGRPLSAPCITDSRILRELKQNPLDLGYRTTVWTVKVLAQHLSHRYHCEIRPFTLYRRMKAMGLECKRPRYIYEEKDPNRAQKKGRSPES